MKQNAIQWILNVNNAQNSTQHLLHLDVDWEPRVSRAWFDELLVPFAEV